MIYVKNLLAMPFIKILQVVMKNILKYLYMKNISITIPCFYSGNLHLVKKKPEKLIESKIKKKGLQNLA
jgi:hypothetical protein